MSDKIKGFDKLRELLGEAKKRPTNSAIPAQPDGKDPRDSAAKLNEPPREAFPKVPQPSASGVVSRAHPGARITPTGPSAGVGLPKEHRPQARTGGPSRLDGSVDVIIGLDFGTRFTKACYRFYGDERSSVAEGPNGPLWASRIFVDATSGEIYARRTATTPKELFELSYLKMRLKNPSASEFAPNPRISKFLPSGWEEAFAALYLSTVMRQSRAFILNREVGRFRGRDPRWQINLSVPAQYQDDGVAELFRTVGEVALLWSEESEIPGPVSAQRLLEKFLDDSAKIVSRRRVEVFAEIVAALHHFVQRPDTPEGVHGFLDIGGGTLDGCVFRLIRDKSGPQVNVLAARVEPLGTVAVATKAITSLYQNLHRTIEEGIVTATESDIRVRLPLDRGEEDVQKFTGGLMASARDRSPYRTLKQPPSLDLSDPTRLTRDDHFVLQCSGGGASSSWYKRTIEGTHAQFSQAALGIMPYSVRSVTPPTGFPDVGQALFSRFVIAYGLSSPAEDLEQIRCRLPSQLGVAATLPNRQSKAADYLSSKDLT